MEFKGTKQKWQAKDSNVYADNKLIISCWSSRATDESRQEGESWLDMRIRTEPERTLNNETEPQANAKLIACAPELLEFINEYKGFLNLKDQKKAIELIKRATE